MRKIIIASCIVFFALEPAGAEFIDGNKWLAWSGGSEGEQMAAHGYVAGVFDAGQGAVHCAPDEIKLGQVVQMSREYITHNIAHADKSADIFILRMLKQLFPCPEKRGTHHI